MVEISLGRTSCFVDRVTLHRVKNITEQKYQSVMMMLHLPISSPTE